GIDRLVEHTVNTSPRERGALLRFGAAPLRWRGDTHRGGGSEGHRPLQHVAAAEQCCDVMACSSLFSLLVSTLAGSSSPSPSGGLQHGASRRPKSSPKEISAPQGGVDMPYRISRLGHVEI